MRLRALTVITLVLLAAACAQQAPAPYAQRYAAALDRYPGVALDSTAPIDAFVAFFSSHADEPAASSELYAAELYFSDTLLTSERHDEVMAHLARMRSGPEALQVSVIDVQLDDADVYVVWRMRARFTPLRRTVESDTIGMTHLRFDEAGRIVLQQDFWDSTEGFYRHIPVVGSLVNSVAGRFSSAD